MTHLSYEAFNALYLNEFNKIQIVHYNQKRKLHNNQDGRELTRIKKLITFGLTDAMYKIQEVINTSDESIRHLVRICCRLHNNSAKSPFLIQRRPEVTRSK